MKLNDKDLAEIPPLKANLALNYEMEKSKYSWGWLQLIVGIVMIDRQCKRTRIASGYAFNLKYANQLHKNFDVTIGW